MRWHWAVIPEAVDVAVFKLAVRGHVNQAISLSLADLLAMPRSEVAAVCQCSGIPRFVPAARGGAQWENGAMGVRGGPASACVTCSIARVSGGGCCGSIQRFGRSGCAGSAQIHETAHIDHARDGEVIVAFQMNGEPLPLNGFPVRLVVPGRYSDYWVKMLSTIEVLDARTRTTLRGSRIAFPRRHMRA